MDTPSLFFLFLVFAGGENVMLPVGYITGSRRRQGFSPPLCALQYFAGCPHISGPLAILPGSGVPLPLRPLYRALPKINPIPSVPTVRLAGHRSRTSRERGERGFDDVRGARTA